MANAVEAAAKQARGGPLDAALSAIGLASCRQPPTCESSYIESTLTMNVPSSLKTSHLSSNQIPPFSAVGLDRRGAERPAGTVGRRTRDLDPVALGLCVAAEDARLERWLRDQPAFDEQLGVEAALFVFLEGRVPVEHTLRPTAAATGNATTMTFSPAGIGKLLRVPRRDATSGTRSWGLRFSWNVRVTVNERPGKR